MKAFFVDLYTYNQHCNQQIYAELLAHSHLVSEKAEKLFNHVLNAQHIWNGRVLAQKPLYGVWEIHSLEDLKDIMELNFKNSLQILNQEDLDRVVQYSNSKGEIFQNKVQHMMFHVINHSTYHRAQMATEFKQAGLIPLATDYIFYKRKV